MAEPGIFRLPGSRTPKRYRAGTHRAAAPEETLARVRRLFPIVGITRVANVTGLDRIGIPVVMVCRPNSRSLAVAQGKGPDLASARASGVMESIESWHAERITAPLKLASWEELRYTHRVTDAESLPRIAGGRFHPGRRLLWIEGRDLLADAPVWLPFELVHMDYRLPLPSGSGCFPATSNGLASGNHPLEALVHGLAEVIERDAITLWLLRPASERASTRIEPASVTDPVCAGLLEQLDAAGIATAVFDITSDLGVPAFLCQLMERDARELLPFGWAGGTGCHPDKSVALARAITEAAQARLTQISGSRDDLTPADYSEHAAELLRRQRQWITASGGRSLAATPSFEGETFEDDVFWLLERLQAAGLPRAIVVDLTRPEFRIPVLRVVVPGLEDGVETPNYLPGARALAAAETRHERDRLLGALA